MDDEQAQNPDLPETVLGQNSVQDISPLDERDRTTSVEGSFDSPQIAQSPNTFSPSQKSLGKNFKGPLAAIFVLFFVVAALLLVYFLNKQDESTSLPVLSQPEINNTITLKAKNDTKTEQWSLYANDKASFAISFPSGWDKTYKADTNAEVFSGEGLFSTSHPESIKDSDQSGIIEGVIASVIVYKKDGSKQKVLDILESDEVKMISYTNGKVEGVLGTQEKSPFRNSKRKVFLVEGDVYDYAIEAVWSKDMPEQEVVLDAIIASFNLIPNKPGWKYYSSDRLGYINNPNSISFQYPTTWRTEEYFNFDRNAVKVVLNNGGNSASDRDTELVLGDYEAYSTSGGVCANQYCEDAGVFRFIVNKKNIEAGLIKASRGKTKEFEHYTFGNGTDDELNLPAIYATYHTEAQGDEIRDILSTLTLHR